MESDQPLRQALRANKGSRRRVRYLLSNTDIFEVCVNFQPAAHKLAWSPPAEANDPYLSDPEQYRSKMAQYIDEDDAENAVFYQALLFAHELHAGQKRKSGDPYISHPFAVAEILAHELKLKDPHLLAAALLHDVVEDVPSIQLEDIQERFGEVVAELVDGCTKLTRHYPNKAILKDLTHSKIFLTASRRLGVLIIKLADRLHNLRTLHHLPKPKRQRIAHETIEVYAPIAAKLNIFPVKRELYHLALSYLYPKKSKKILQFIRGFRSSPVVVEFENELEKALGKFSSAVTIRPRAKGLGSYYDPIKKTLDISNSENHMDFAVILDTQDTVACYSALGIVNSMFPPIPRTLRDFISNPKMNGYRSLHVRVHVAGQNYLIKIRTPEMDEFAAYGILTRWSSDKPMSEEHWQEISELLRSIGEYGGAGPQRKALIRLSEAEETFVYSPKGDIYYLPKGSVVLDFAYKIHSELGDHCKGAHINNEWAPPTRALSDGDVVEIVTSPEPYDVDPELEELCKTPKARTALNKHLQQKRLRYAQDIGHQILLQEINRHGLSSDILKNEDTRLILEFHNIKNLPELFVRVGQDLISPHVVLYYFIKPQARDKDQNFSPGRHLFTHERNVLTVPELDRGIHKFARCCNPFPGQQNVLAVLSERGITFHHRDCSDLLDRHDLEPQRLLEVHWDEASVWRRPLVFTLRVFQEKVQSVIRSLANLLNTSAQIEYIGRGTDKHNQPVVLITVKIQSFGEAREFFRCLPTDRITIDNYGQEEGPRTIH